MIIIVQLGGPEAEVDVKTVVWLTRGSENDSI